MKRIFLALFCCLLIFGGSTSRAESPSSPSPVNVERIDLQMKDLDSEVLFKKEPYDKSTFPVQVIDNNSTLPGTIEVKGSFTRQFLKKSLMIKLDKGHAWRGNRKISLTAMATDPSMMRDWLSWDLISSLNMARPKVDYVSLYINDKYIGLFMFFEWIGPETMARYGHGKDGQLFHPIDATFCGDFSLPTISRLAECFFKLSPGDENFSPLAELIKGINETKIEEFNQFIEKNFDVDSLINWVVVNTLTGNGDSYKKNYFLYQRNDNKKWVMIPWDYDLTFGRNADPVLPYPRQILNDNFQYNYSPELGNPSPLKEKLLQNKELYKRFKQRISHVLGVSKDNQQEGGFAWFMPDTFSKKIEQLRKVILKDFAGELYYHWNRSEFDRHVDAIKYFNRMRFHRLKKMILGVSAFNSPYWLPYTAYPAVESAASISPNQKINISLDLLSNLKVLPTAGQYVFIDDQFAYPLALLDVAKLNHPAKVRMEIETESTPDFLPPGLSAKSCIQKTWFLDIKTPASKLTADLTLDYLQESTIRNELGSAIKNEKLITLWMFQAGHWTKLPTEINTYSNAMKVKAVTLSDKLPTRFVACERGGK